MSVTASAQLEQIYTSLRKKLFGFHPIYAHPPFSLMFKDSLHSLETLNLTLRWLLFSGARLVPNLFFWCCWTVHLALWKYWPRQRVAILKTPKMNSIRLHIEIYFICSAQDHYPFFHIFGREVWLYVWRFCTHIACCKFLSMTSQHECATWAQFWWKNFSAMWVTCIYLRAVLLQKREREWARKTRKQSSVPSQSFPFRFGSRLHVINVLRFKHHQTIEWERRQAVNEKHYIYIAEKWIYLSFIISGGFPTYTQSHVSIELYGVLVMCVEMKNNWKYFFAASHSYNVCSCWGCHEISLVSLRRCSQKNNRDVDRFPHSYSHTYIISFSTALFSFISVSTITLIMWTRTIDTCCGKYSEKKCCTLNWNAKK